MNSGSKISSGGGKTHEEVSNHLRELSSRRDQAQDQIGFQSLLSTVAEGNAVDGNTGHTSAQTPKIGKATQRVAHSVAAGDGARVENEVVGKELKDEGDENAASKGGAEASKGGPDGAPSRDPLSVPTNILLP